MFHFYFWPKGLPNKKETHSNILKLDFPFLYSDSSAPIVVHFLKNTHDFSSDVAKKKNVVKAA